MDDAAAALSRLRDARLPPSPDLWADAMIGVALGLLLAALCAPLLRRLPQLLARPRLRPRALLDDAARKADDERLVDQARLAHALARRGAGWRALDARLSQRIWLRDPGEDPAALDRAMRRLLRWRWR